MNATTHNFRKLFLAAAMLALITSPGLQAATHTVCASGCDYSSIQTALSAAGSGDVLSLSPETFTEGGILIDKNITIKASAGQATVDGDGELSVFEVDEDAVAILGNLALENATRAMLVNHGIAYLNGVYVKGDGVTDTVYGGIVNYATGYLVLKDNSVVLANRSASLGGGISNFGFLEIRNSTLIGNRGRLGGGFFNSQGTVSVTSTSISFNHATVRGGGYANANVGGGTVAILPSASFSGNTADDDCDKYYDIHVSPACVN